MPQRQSKKLIEFVTDRLGHDNATPLILNLLNRSGTFEIIFLGSTIILIKIMVPGHRLIFVED